MDPVDVILAIFTGICFYAGATHFLIGIRSRPRNWVHLSYSVLSLVFGVLSASIIMLYAAFDTGSLGNYILIDRWSIFFWYLTFAALFWFVSVYTGARNRNLLFIVCGFYIIIALLCLVLPYPWIYNDITLTEVFPPDIIISPWYPVEQVITILLLVIYPAYHIVKQYRRGEKSNAKALGIAMIIYLVSVFWDYGIEYGYIDTILVGEYGFVAFLVLMSLYLSNQSLEGEREYRWLNLELEERVEERTSELQDLSTSLQNEISNRQQVENKLRKRTHELGERVKELNCLFSISAVVERPGITLDEILQSAVALLPPAWQYPDVACARIWLNDRQFTTKNFQETKWKQTTNILVYGEIRGEVEVYYLEEMPKAEEGAFLNAERKLLNAVAERLGRIVERFQAEKNIRHRISELSTLNQIAQIIATTADPLNSLGEIAKEVTDLFSSRIVVFMIPGNEISELQTLVGYERDRGIFTTSNQVFTLNEIPLIKNMMHTGESDYLSDLSSLTIPSKVRAELEALNLYKLLIIPLKILGDVLGLLVLGFDDPNREIGQQEIALAETISGEVAAAITNAHLTEMERQAAIASERQRLARELHDSATQTIYSLTLLSSGWESMARQGILDDPANSFRQLGEVGQQALKEMRLLIHQLRPDSLNDLGLRDALKERLEVVEMRANIEPELIAQGNLDEIPEGMEEQLFYIAQEALNNSLRHAQATEVKVEILENHGQVKLVISDNGKGYDTNQPVTGMGLGNMIERARSIDAEFSISSVIGQGTAISVIAPLRPMKEENE